MRVRVTPNVVGIGVGTPIRTETVTHVSQRVLDAFGITRRFVSFRRRTAEKK